MFFEAVDGIIRKYIYLSFSLPILLRCAPGFFPESLNEIIIAFVSAHFADLPNCIGAVPQQIFGFLYADAFQSLHNGFPRAVCI